MQPLINPRVAELRKWRCETMLNSNNINELCGMPVSNMNPRHLHRLRKKSKISDRAMRCVSSKILRVVWDELIQRLMGMILTGEIRVESPVELNEPIITYMNSISNGLGCVIGYRHKSPLWQCESAAPARSPSH